MADFAEQERERILKEGKSTSKRDDIINESLGRAKGSTLSQEDVQSFFNKLNTMSPARKRALQRKLGG